MKRFHISIATDNYAASVADYSKRLGNPPCVTQEGRYALWRTDILNLSISCKPGQINGSVRHVGFEDDTAKGFSEATDCNGITWETFSREGQLEEIKEKFPEAVITDAL